MSKSLDELLNQKKWTAKDVGLLLLYSAENDIKSSQNNQQKKIVVPQKLFEKAYKNIITPEDSLEWAKYKEIQNILLDIVKENRSMEHQFERFYANQILYFIEMNRAEDSREQIKKLKLSKVQEYLILRPLLNIDSLIYTKDYELEKENIKYCNSWLMYFGISMYVTNYVLSKFFKDFDLEFLKTVLYNTELFEQKITHLNSIYNGLVDKRPQDSHDLIYKIYKPIDCKSLKDICKDCFLARKQDIQDPFSYIFSIKKIIVDITDAVIEFSGIQL